MATKKEVVASKDIALEVGDPQVLRPVDLPLVIKPAAGDSWKNAEQEAYARTLNAAAYVDPINWARVKDAEIARLVEIGNDPSRFYVYSGQQGNIQYPNRLGGNVLGS